MYSRLTMPSKGRDIGSWGFLVALVAIYAAYAALIYDRGINLFGEGGVLGNAQAILQGKVLYRDIVTVYAPGRFYLLALLFEIFGENILVAHLMWLSVRLIGVVILFFLCRKIMPTLFGFLACLLYVFVSGPWFKVFFLFFNIPVVLLLMTYAKRKQAQWLIAAGLLVGAGIVFRQDTGLFMVVLGLVTVPLAEAVEDARSIRRVLLSATYFVASTLAIVVPVAGYFYSKGALGELYYWCFRWSVLVEHVYGLPFPGPLDVTEMATRWETVHGYLARNIFYYLPFVVLCLQLAVSLARLRRGGSLKEEMGIAIIFLWGCMLAYKVIMVPLYRHVIQAELPVYVLGCYLLSIVYLWSAKKGSRGSFWDKALYWTIASMTVILPLFVTFHHVAYSDDMQKDYMRWQCGQVLLNIERAPVHADKVEGKHIERVVDFVIRNTGSGDYIFADTMPGFYFLTGRRHAGRYEVLQPMIFHRDAAEEAALVVELRAKVRYIIHRELSLERKESWKFQDYAPMVNRFLRDECTPAMQAGPYTVYENRRAYSAASP